ncbi:MAG: diphosphate--fructose-6-phosphate 1-phosphotransferase [Polyangiaceae bacterium]
MSIPSARNKLAIVAAGGPAPGINSVIGAATIRACLANVEVLGIQDGFRWLMEGDTSHVAPLSIADTSRIHFRGGSHIGISRANPTRDPEAMKNTLRALDQLGVGSLITIGGDGTAYSAYRLAQAAGGALRIAHVPKTIDNDIDLPNDISTFGFQTARHIGVELVKNLMVDAKTTSRWYFVVAQGRKAGHLALSIGKAAGATISLIPEEFPKGSHFADIVDTLVGSIIKRLSHGRTDGVAMLAEGLVECFPVEELAALTQVPRDPFGNIHAAKIKLGDILRDAVETRLLDFKLKGTIVGKSIGYEVRCADPIPFDMEYTRDLGYCAARFIIEGGSNAMISIQNGDFTPIPMEKMIDLENGRTRIRMVDIDSDRYKIARSYMLRLKREDIADVHELRRLAQVANVNAEEFRATFGRLVANEPMPMRLSSSPDARLDPSA